MTLHVTTDSLLGDVQEQFRQHFPGFKLEFFFSSAEKITQSTHLNHSFPFVRIRELKTQLKKTSLDIKDSMTIAELEKKFFRKFGLPARVYKKAGDYWQKKASDACCRLNDCPEISNGVYFLHAGSKLIPTDFSLQMGG